MGVWAVGGGREGVVRFLSTREGCGFASPLPGGVLEVVLRIPREVGHLRAECSFLLGRVRVIILEEGNGEVDFRVRGASAKGFVAGLDVQARVQVIPRDVLANQVAELPHREVPLLLVPGGHGAVELHDGVQQVARLLLVQGDMISDLALASRAKHALVATPDGLAVHAGPERVVDSLVVLGLLGGLGGHVEFDLERNGGDGFHGLRMLALACLCASDSPSSATAFG